MPTFVSFRVSSRKKPEKKVPPFYFSKPPKWPRLAPSGPVDPVITVGPIGRGASPVSPHWPRSMYLCTNFYV